MSKAAKKTTAATKAEAYLNHRAGSRKSKVHQVFDKEGKEKALIFGKKQGLKESSVRSWISSWTTNKAAEKKAAKKVSVAKKAASAPKKKVTAKKVNGTAPEKAAAA